jgi:hypothetical protein
MMDVPVCVAGRMLSKLLDQQEGAKAATVWEVGALLYGCDECIFLISDRLKKEALH